MPTITPSSRDIESLLREVIAELQAIRRALKRQRPSHLTRADRTRLSAILPVIAGIYGSELFPVRELLEHPSPALRLVLAGLNARALGRLFQRAEGEIIAGYLVERQGVEARAILWRIVAAS